MLDYADSKTRASLAQTLEVKCGSTECPAFTLVVNHLKSKGSSCDSIGDPDTGDGQVGSDASNTYKGLIYFNKGSTDRVP